MAAMSWILLSLLAALVSGKRRHLAALDILEQINLQDACSNAVPNSVKRDSFHYSKSCKCPRGTIMVGTGEVPDELCTTFSRKFSHLALKGHGCVCEAGVSHTGETTSGAEYETWDWMKTLDDESHLNALTIPGTHDTMAYKFKQGQVRNLTGMTLTHEDDLKLQLDRGIRWFDVRIGLQADAVVTCHGPFEMICDLECMLAEASLFLSDHPSEALFVMLKPECGEKGQPLSQKVLSLLQNFDLVLRGDKLMVDTTLKSVRGRIVIVDTETWDALPGFKEGAEQAKIGFISLTGTLTGPSQDVQNDFNLHGPTKGRKAKIQAVEKFLRWCGAHDSDSMRVNYFSASGVGYNVMTTASVINMAVLDALEEGFHGDLGHAFGACLLDGLPTAGPVIKLIRSLIDRNFQSDATIQFMAQWHAGQRNTQKLLKSKGIDPSKLYGSQMDHVGH